MLSSPQGVAEFRRPRRRLSFSLADQAELPDFTASLVGSSTSGDLFICAKDLLVEANPAMWR